MTLCGSLHAKALQATVSERLAQGRYAVARAGFKPTTLRSKGFDSTNAPPRQYNRTHTYNVHTQMHTHTNKHKHMHTSMHFLQQLFVSISLADVEQFTNLIYFSIDEQIVALRERQFRFRVVIRRILNGIVVVLCHKDLEWQPDSWKRCLSQSVNTLHNIVAGVLKCRDIFLHCKAKCTRVRPSREGLTNHTAWPIKIFLGCSGNIFKLKSAIFNCLHFVLPEF